MKALDGDNNTQPVHFGHSFIAINPEFFMGLDICRKTVAQFAELYEAPKRLQDVMQSIQQGISNGIIGFHTPN